MKIDRMKVGQLYTIKEGTVVETGNTGTSSCDLPVIKGWRHWMNQEKREPFLYLGWKMEDWTYEYQHTNKIHYILWKEQIYVMDNQFAKHIVPLWEVIEDG